ncbi:hypothetical protein [Desulfobulbus sp.]|uniref:hypothetical protein n=1 Tax=Desulfobulbus sp. TaxID=895 RepID=UPI00286F958F|nr:hypothetical protein [Desulfobulbus sp.]
MNNLGCDGRWPPIYDFDGLGEEIKGLVSSKEIFNFFFFERNLEPILCQGDILKFAGQFPFVDELGNIKLLEEEYDYWMILGNTCDLQRDISSPHYSHITPIIPLTTDTPGQIISKLQSYSTYKKFYIPSWGGGMAQGFYIDFTLICSIDKKCLSTFTELVARLTMKSWLLLHSCLVRYLARDDGRHD